jgi:4-hydroxybenzoate polyprenyltransferase
LTLLNSVDGAGYVNQSSAEPSVALAVDLDGTLCRSDTLHDALCGLVLGNPRHLLALPGWLVGGKTAFKADVADHRVPDVETLPYDPDVLQMIRDARAAGRTTALVSASDHRVVAAVAQHLGLFDIAVGTGSPETDGVNLSGPAKAQWLTDRFGPKGYDYVGDSRADVQVWASARHAIAVRPGKGVENAANRAGVALQHLGSPTSLQTQLRVRVRAMRPHQWAKNLLVFVPALAAHQTSGLFGALIAFVSFSLTASAVYLINDLSDLSADRAHPRKHRRPFAAGLIPVGDGIAMAAGLLVTALGIALAFLPIGFTALLALYLATTFAYSLWLKRTTLVDILALSGLYTLRIVGGAAAVGVVLSPWLLAFSMFIFFSLAAIKRQAELVDMERTGRETMAGRGYVASDLPVIRTMAITSGQAAVLVLALYVNSSDMARLYAEPAIVWLVCPVVFYWLSRVQLLTHRGYMNDDPIVFALRDRKSLACAAIVLGLMIVAVTGWGVP